RPCPYGELVDALPRLTLALSWEGQMYHSKISRRPKWLPLLMVVALVALAIVAIRFREPVLRAAGWALVVNEPVESADIIVVSLDSGGAGALETADLVQGGVSKRAAVFMDAPNEE